MVNMRTSRGFTLIEMCMAVIVVGLVSIVLVSLSALLSKSFTGVRIKNRANDLAIAAMEEIRCRKWDELTAPLKSATLGRDTGETLGVKTSFDDIDDFNGYIAAPPQYQDGTPMPGLAGYSVTVAVSYVDASLNVSGTATARKKIVVTVKKDNTAKATLNTILSQQGGL